VASELTPASDASSDASAELLAGDSVASAVTLAVSATGVGVVSGRHCPCTTGGSDGVRWTCEPELSSPKESPVGLYPVWKSRRVEGGALATGSAVIDDPRCNDSPSLANEAAGFHSPVSPYRTRSSSASAPDSAMIRSSASDIGPSSCPSGLQ
jgi:hypothetical protein